MHPDAPTYTFWDYKRTRWQRDPGLRIDHLLLNPKAAKRLVEAGVDREVRGLEGASDHAPAWILLRDAPAARRKPVRRLEKQTRPESRRSARRTAPHFRQPLLVIDGDSFAHRSYHALPKTILGRGRKPAGAILGFANVLLRLYRDEQPRAVLVAWDTLEVPTYRHDKFPAYQSGREFDDALLKQLASPSAKRRCADVNQCLRAEFRNCGQQHGVIDAQTRLSSAWRNALVDLRPPVCFPFGAGDRGRTHRAFRHRFGLYRGQRGSTARWNGV